MYAGGSGQPPPPPGGGGGSQPPQPHQQQNNAGGGGGVPPPPGAAAPPGGEPGAAGASSNPNQQQHAPYGGLHGGPPGLLADPFGYAALEHRQQELEMALHQRRQALASQLQVEEEMNYARQMAAAEMLNRAEAERQMMQREGQLLAMEREMLAQQAAERERRALLVAEAEAAAAAAHAQRAAAASAPHHPPPRANEPTAVAAPGVGMPPPPPDVASEAPPSAPGVAAAGAPTVAAAATAANPSVVQADGTEIPPVAGPGADAPASASAAPDPASAVPTSASAEAEAKKPGPGPKSKSGPKKSKSKAAGTGKGKTGASPSGKAKKAAATKRKSPSKDAAGGAALRAAMPSLEDPVPPITDQDYANLEALMIQFCRVPLLAEFSRPLSMLHPELVTVYSKVVKHPVDLGKVCRSVRRREYRDTRAVRLEMWRIFANCIKFHCHPSTREGAIPSFVSIALHLREYFNALWEEYMLPSEAPAPTSKSKSKASVNPTEAAYQKSFKTREERRKKRLVATATTALSSRCLERVASEIESFVDSGGRVDGLDTKPIQSVKEDEATNEDEDYEAVMGALMELSSKLANLANENEEYSVRELEVDLKKCYSRDVFDDRPALRKTFAVRLSRLLGKSVVPIYETNCRGVNQSSVWGCMAAAIWARESSKKPFWPSLVLGILAPEDQREDWHQALTERNEARLPESLRQQLESGKKKAVAAIKRQSTGKAERMSFFLVEFLGTHEFTWVRESDIIEQFDPEEDPDTVGNEGSKKKKRHYTRDHRHTPQTERLRQKAVEEGRWALEEFEMQLNDTCGDLYLSDVEEDEEDGYTYEVLCQSDDDEDEEVKDGGAATATSAAYGGAGGDTERSISDEEEILELLLTEGMLDYSAAGRKAAKKRIAALKKQKSEKLKAAQKKKKAEQDKKKKAAAKQAKEELARKKKKKLEAAASSKSKAKASTKKLEREQQKQQKELEKRRKKRKRERELVEKKGKKARLSSFSADKRGSRKASGIPDKKDRATAVVRGYLTRIAKREDLAGLGFSGSSAALPASAVEATGLLGMALAFRAAAGYVEMPVGKGEEPAKKAWDKIDTDGPAKAEDRCKNLERQAELLEQEISRLDRENNQRMVLIAQAHRQREANEKVMIAVEERIKTVPAGIGTKKKNKPKKLGGESEKTTTTTPTPVGSATIPTSTNANSMPEASSKENDGGVAKDSAADEATADQATDASVEEGKEPSTSTDVNMPAVPVAEASSTGEQA